jgi:thioredoxin-related protein
MNINNLKKLTIAIVLLAMFPGFGHLLAQNANLSGIWVLKQRQVLSGPDYANGIPKQMTIAFSQDSLSLSRIYDGGSDKDNIVSESLALDGSPTEVLRTISRRKSLYKKGSDANEFSVEVTFRDIKTGQRTNADYVENWKVSESGKELTIEKNATGADGSNWGVKGVYELKTKEEVEQELETGKGIQFIENLSWEEVKALAKKENKFIFVDCFATWCVPCKKMEKEIFPLNKVGAEMNDKFISVHLQMDTTKRDDEEVKKWYTIAHEFLTKYNLVGYPTFLFFDPNCNIVHKGLGSYKVEEFIELLQNARDPNKQYYSLLNGFQKGTIDHEKMYDLVWAAKNLQEEKQAQKVLVDYKKRHLNKLSLDSLLSPKYLKLANDFQQLLILQDGSKGIFFTLLYEKGNQVDNILSSPGFSSYWINAIITKEEIDTKLFRSGKPTSNPEWNTIAESIKKKYKKIDADLLILNSQIDYYEKRKDWNNQIKYLVGKIEKYGPLSLGQLSGMGADNAIASILLPHCEDKSILSKAVGWMEQIINGKAYAYPIPMVYGNYGAILFKAGLIKEGIEAFEKQINYIGYGLGYKSPDDFVKEPRLKPKVEYLERMKKGEKIDSSWDPAVFF